MGKLVCWALFDSETGDYRKAVNKYFKNEIDIYGVGLSHDGKSTASYINFDLSQFGELFGGPNIADKLLAQLPRPDIIVASPPCESWSHMTSVNNGNIHWKRYESKLLPSKKIFQLQDINAGSGFVKNNGILTFYCRVNGELCHQNTWEIIKRIKPKVFMVENPENYCWEYITNYVPNLPKIHLNKLVYSAYDPENFSPKREIFASNLKLSLKKYTVNKNGNSIKGDCDIKGKISKNYSTRSQVPALALKDFFNQAIKYIRTSPLAKSN